MCWKIDHMSHCVICIRWNLKTTRLIGILMWQCVSAVYFSCLVVRWKIDHASHCVICVRGALKTTRLIGGYLCYFPFAMCFLAAYSQLFCRHGQGILLDFYIRQSKPGTLHAWTRVQRKKAKHFLMYENDLTVTYVLTWEYKKAKHFPAYENVHTIVLCMYWCDTCWQCATVQAVQD